MKKLIAILASICIFGCGCAGVIPAVVSGVASGLMYGGSVSVKPMPIPIQPGPVQVVIDPATGKMELKGIPGPVGVEIAPGADVPPMVVPVK